MKQVNQVLGIGEILDQEILTIIISVHERYNSSEILEGSKKDFEEFIEENEEVDIISIFVIRKGIKYIVDLDEEDF